jgi:hypothetical protein
LNRSDVFEANFQINEIGAVLTPRLNSIPARAAASK